MKKVPDYREIETCISIANIKDQVGALLYAAGMVHDDEDIIDIVFDVPPYKGVSQLPITIKLKKHQEVETLHI